MITISGFYCKSARIKLRPNINSDEFDENLIGLEKSKVAKTRVNQYLFRKMLLVNYNSRCCITNINIPELLIASHILPWSEDTTNRLNPTNGLLLNSLHDKAFENGLFVVTEDYTIKIAPKLNEYRHLESISSNFIKYDGQTINLPDKFCPNIEFLKKHRDRFAF